MLPATQSNHEEEGYRFLLPKRADELGERLGSRCRVEITPFQVRAREELGPLHWTWRHNWSTETEFEVADRSGRSGHKSLFGIRMWNGTQQTWFAMGYPQAKLEALVEHLNAAKLEWVTRSAAPEDARSDAPSAAPSAVPSAAPSDVARMEAPATRGTQIQFRKTADGLRVDVPPIGLAKGTRGLFGIGLAFTAFTLFMGAILLWSMGSSGQSGDLLVIGAALLFFLTIGALMTVAGWNLCTRSAIIVLDEDDLKVSQTSVLGVNDSSYPRFTVTNIKCGPSGLIVNGKPVSELQIFTRGHKALGMLAMRGDADLERIAQALMTALTADSESPDSESDTAPE